MITSRALANGQIAFEQKAVGPSIYLDQWVWCELSEDDDMRKRFIRSALSRNCCIMYSIASLMELAQISDQGQLRALAEVMDSLDFGFVEMDPSRVIALEKQHESETTGVFNGRHPAADLDMLNCAIRRHYPLMPKMSAVLRDLKQEIPSRYKRIADRLEESLTPMVERAKSDSIVLARAKANNRERSIRRSGPPYTEDILRTLNFFLVANEKMKMSGNEWVDVFHLVIPVAYLEFVALDKRWIHFIRNHLPLSPPNIATVYGPGELESFIQGLDLGDRDGTPPASLARAVS